MVGARYSQNASNTEGVGKAYVYKTTDGTWSDATLIHTINNPNNIRDDSFGQSVAIEGNYVAIGINRRGLNYAIIKEDYTYSILSPDLKLHTLITPTQMVV